MRNIFYLFFLIANLIYSQMPSVVQQDLMNYEPGELIVKLKDNVDAGVYFEENGKAKSDFNIGEFLGIEDKIESSKVMFHQSAIEASVANSQKMKAVYAAKGMQNVVDPLTMKNIFVLKTINQQENILMLIEEIKNNPNVEYAEPNYIYSIDDYEVGDIIYDDSGNESEEESENKSTANISVDDPLYSAQSNITSTNIDDVWDQYTTGDGSQVVAILDTGGDYTHPDLEANTWINTAELNGVEDYDDDGNGYVDDIRGWDFINLDNAPLDDNMHGTHVAGIVGAVGNNGIGIAGAAWNVKLMHIKVFQSTGQGSSITIAEGVEYAYMNGATILNMSFGSYALSSVLKTALENAYSTSILVAAAGNNSVCLGPGLYCAPMFPAAFPWVLAVEDRPRPIMGYTNYDSDGPIVSRYNSEFFYNYELAAPGTGIMSTVPGGGYASLTGTSMATPLVAGGLALYNQQKPDDSNEIIFGNLINTSANAGQSAPGFVNILAAIEIEPSPQLAVISSTNEDDINNQNNNGYWEPGETIEILPLVKNYWGPTDDVRVGIEFCEFEDTSKATIIQDEIQIGSISAYATLQDLEETLKITISEGLTHNVDIKFCLTAWSGPDQEYMSEPTEIVITNTNAIIYTDYITEDTTFTPDREYIFESPLVIADGATLIIEAGTTLKMEAGAYIQSCPTCQIFSNGTSENPVTITSNGSGYWNNIIIEDFPRFFFDGASNNGRAEVIDIYDENGNSLPSFHAENLEEIMSIFGMQKAVFNYTIFEFFGIDISGSYSTIQGGVYKNCIFRDFYNNGSIFLNGFYVEKSVIDEVITQNSSKLNHVMGDNGLSYYNNTTNLIGGNVNNSGGRPNFVNAYQDSNLESFPLPFRRGVIGANLSGLLNGPESPENMVRLWGTANDNDVSVTELPTYIWFGTSSEQILEDDHFWHFGNVPSIIIGQIDFSTALTQPFEENHGIVWKVEVNGKDAQDEYDLMDPVGVGTHEFKVYFNREMDTSVDPQISYGVTMPYTQNSISEEGTWSSDGKIYTVNHEVNIGAADGINRIRVQGAQDLDYFKIPVEDYRFNMLVQSAGSASTGFFATPGLGKIDLEWVAPSTDELDDVLGYNMYRYQVDADGNESDPVPLNDSLIIEDSDESTTGIYFTDFDVVEGETYFYKYKILRTSFEETDYSNAVSASPLTSLLGDSNGDFAVNVLDLVHDVDYILGNNPTPFIFVAGDVNADETINVLDIVGTVDIILNENDANDTEVDSQNIQFYPSTPVGYARFTWEGDDLYVESEHNIGGIQLAFDQDFEYVLNDLPGIERLDYEQEDQKVLMLYSFNNNSIASNKTKLLTRINSQQEINIDLAVVGTTTGSKLTPVFEGSDLDDIDAPLQSDQLEFMSMIPNPSDGLVTLKYYLPEQMDGVVAKVYDMLGRMVFIQPLERAEGESQVQMQLDRLQKGNYIVLITADKDGGLRHIANKILVIK